MVRNFLWISPKWEILKLEKKQTFLFREEVHSWLRIMAPQEDREGAAPLDGVARDGLKFVFTVSINSTT
jgi:hypothetical protein